MIEPELLRTLERLENEEFLDAANPELPLPSAAGGEDYLSILQDLRSTLGDPEETFEDPETAFPDPQNILELGGEVESAPNSAEFVNEFELLPETDGFDFSADKTNETFSDFELKLPDEVISQKEANSETESANPELLSKESETSDPDSFAEPENDSRFLQSPIETVQPELKTIEEPDTASLEDFLARQEFNRSQQTENLEIPTNSLDSQPDESSLELEPPEFFNEFNFEENAVPEPFENLDSSAEIGDESDQGDFEFIESVEENEFPEILHDEETDEFSSEILAPEEILASETISDFEAENFAPEVEDFSDFLPSATKDFLSEFDDQPELPQFKASETSSEILPEPVIADKIEESNEIRNPFVVFRLDSRYFAFPASAVAEIGHEPQFTTLPFVPSWFSGVTNLRGDVVAVLDLRGLWEMNAAPEIRRKMLVIRSEKENLTVGLLVDAVSEIRYFGESEINSACEFSEEPFSFCSNGSSQTEETPMTILDVERFLASPKLRQL